jgi:Domain of unknown function (DUF4349)
MRRPELLLAGAVFVLFVLSCGQAHEKAAMSSDEAAPEAAAAGNTVFLSANGAFEMDGEEPGKPQDPETMSSNAARPTGDTLRRFIRTADLRFRVKDAVQSTYAIEDLIASFGGHVEHTQLTSRVDNRYTTPISEDSLLETTKFTVVNTATLRVPVAKLDTALKSLARFVDFLDHRTVKAEDVRLLLLSNRMAQQRIARHQQRMEGAIDEQGKKLRETAGAEDRLLDRQEQADEARLSNMGLEDRIAYSTITIDLYQRQSARYEVLPAERSIDSYRPGFFAQLGEALSDGWQLLMDFVLLLARSWSVLLIIALLFLVLRRIFQNKPQK